MNHESDRVGKSNQDSLAIRLFQVSITAVGSVLTMINIHGRESRKILDCLETYNVQIIIK